MSDFDWEDSVNRIRAITEDLRIAMDKLDQAFDSAETKGDKQDALIKQKVQNIVLASK